MHKQTLAQLAKALNKKLFSSVELMKHYLTRISHLEPELNSFITVTDEEALAAAAKADQIRAKQSVHTLHGLPIAHKDIFCTQGVKTTCGSKMLENFISPYDATVVDKLKRAGMILIGKTNMDEFAMGSSNENSYFGSVRNPWDLSTVPGGSSGGSAAAVAARLTPAATGTDTGGSIRQPAALCGITGLKPTYGRVSRYGMIAYASSLDQGGPMTQTAEDAALIMNVISGFDKKDSTSVREKVPDYSARLNDSIKGLKIGLPKEYFGEGLNREIETAIQSAIQEYEKMGAVIKDVSLPHTNIAVATYYIVGPAECSSNLSRFDGVRFGYRAEQAESLYEMYCLSRGQGFGAEVKRRIMVGTFALSSGYYDAYYLQAQRARQLIAEDFKKAFNEVDVLLAPTTPTPSFRLGEKTGNPISMYLSDIYTIAVNLAGLPAISIPCGEVYGRLVGMQLIGNYFAEEKLLNVAHQFQCATTWHQTMPELYY